MDGGQEQVSQSNVVKLLDGDLSVTLKGAGSADIGRRTVDDAQTLDAVKKFADSYNGVLNFLNKYKDKSASLSNLAYSYGTTRLHSSALSQIGIDVDSKGRLSINEGRFKDALRDNREDVEKALGAVGGLAYGAYSKTVSTMQISKNLYPKPSSLSHSNMYRRNRSYVNPHMSGLYINYLV